MPFPKYAAFLTGLLLTAFMLPAQKARYADTYLGYDLKIPGLIKNAIHVWSASSHLNGFYGRKITLTLHIFSPDMHLISEKELPLGWINYWLMTFQYADTCYYANIVYGDLKQKRLLLKIDQYGNFTDISTVPGKWPNNFPADEKNMFYASAGNRDNLYSVQIEHVPAGDSSATDGIMALPGEVFTSSSAFEKLTVKKINRTTLGWIKLEYGSNSTPLYNPHISVNDTTFLVTATTPFLSLKPEPGSFAKDPLLLVARFHTSLSDSSVSTALLKSAIGRKSERYLPVNHFALKNNVLLVSSGIYSNSLKITMFDEKNRLMKDTILEDQDRGSFQWNNSITFSTPGMAHFFCLKKYTNSKSGVLHISIAGDGTIEQQDMIVNASFDYRLYAAKQLQPGLLLVPYIHRSKTGLLQLSY